MPSGQNYPRVKAFTAPAVFENTATFQKGIATGSAAGGQPAAVTSPAVPASTVAAVNATGYDVMVYLTMTGVTATHVTVNGNDVYTSAVSGALYLPAGGTISLTYSAGTPTWVWQAV